MRENAISWEPVFLEAAQDEFQEELGTLLAIVRRYKTLSAWVARQNKVAATYPNMRTDMMLACLGFQDNWREIFIPYFKTMVKSSQGITSQELGLQFDLRNLPGEAWYADHSLVFAQVVGVQTEEDIRALLQTGEREGLSMQTMGRHLRTLFSQYIGGNQTPAAFTPWFEARMPRYRAEMISRTETIRVSTAGNEHLYERWGVAYKQWFTGMDERTCPFCAVMHGELIQVGENYFTEGQSMEVPRTNAQGEQVGVDRLSFTYGHVKGPPLHPNCRCALLPYMPEWEALGIEPLRGPDVLPAPPTVDVPPTPEEMREGLIALDAGRALEYMDLKDARRTLNEAATQAFKDYDTAMRNAGLSLASTRAEVPADILPLYDYYKTAAGLYKQSGHEIRAFGRVSKQLLREFLYHPDGPASGKLIASNAGPGTWTKAVKDKFKESFVEATKLLGPSFILGNVSAQLQRADYRASARRKTVKLAPSDKPWVVVHEIGHVAEFTNAKVRRQAQRFLKDRAGKESTTEIYSGSGEMGWKDKFIDHYMGKEYTGGSTEIISMGLQLLYENPLKLAVRDPEYFDLMMEWTRQ